MMKMMMLAISLKDKKEAFKTAVMQLINLKMIMLAIALKDKKEAF